ncbi:MAG: SDR family oxidoreductase [Cytophagales bacterium]|nr:SDR family oxidoreductase [Cytophagales bacterium]
MAHALITGASGGIGLALARELASRKHDVLLIARSEALLKQHCDELHRSHGVSADYLAVDLSQHNAVEQVEAWIKQKNYSIEILINNAGYGTWGPVREIPAEQLTNMMHLNMHTVAGLSKAMIPYLEKQKKGYIMNVSSTAAYQAVPTLATYAATKGFVLLFTRGLHWELKGTGISVSCLSPGPTTSGFIDRANLGMIKERAEKFSMKPEAVASIAIDGMFAGKAEIIPGFINWISAKFAELVPKVLTEKIAMNLYKTSK